MIIIIFSITTQSTKSQYSSSQKSESDKYMKKPTKFNMKDCMQ